MAHLYEEAYQKAAVVVNAAAEAERAAELAQAGQYDAGDQRASFEPTPSNSQIGMFQSCSVLQLKLPVCCV